jgi:hypothetical protein
MAFWLLVLVAEKVGGWRKAEKVPPKFTVLALARP